MAVILSDAGIQFANGSIQPAAAQPALAPITASITSNAITVTLTASALAFRNTTLTNGAITYVNTAASLTLVIAATDSFGLVTASGNQRLAILAINNAGTMELAATAIYGGVKLDETGVITTATASTTATGIKAGAVRTGVAYRVVGFVDATFTTATGWGSLALVQGQGGNAATAFGSLGYGQTWQNVTGSRALGTTYYNLSGKPIVVAVSLQTGATITLVAGGNTISQIGAGVGTLASITGVVPSGMSYILTTSSGGTVNTWCELR